MLFVPTRNKCESMGSPTERRQGSQPSFSEITSSAGRTNAGIIRYKEFAPGFECDRIMKGIN